MAQKKTRDVYRDAGTGRFVTKEYAERHPGTTVTETVSVKPRAKRRKK
jgi:hypothetical protein